MSHKPNHTSTHFIQIMRAFLLFVVFCVVVIPAQASGGEEGEKFRPGDMIMHHISDAHQIHLIGQIHIPLPVILFHEGHVEFFSSSNFWDGYDEKGELKFKPYTTSSGVTFENHHEIIVVAGGHSDAHSSEAVHAVHSGSTLIHDSAHTELAHVLADSLATPSPEALETAQVEHSKPLDFSITKSVFGMLLVIVIMIFLFRGIAKSYEKRKGQAPRGAQNLFEPFILFIRNEVAIPSIGARKADRYVPFLLTSFFFIWMCNMLGLVPFFGGFNVTGTLSITLVLAAMVFLITSFSGNKHYWGHIFWPPGVPLPIKIILVPIEIMSIFIKPAVLMIRLTANITAGHIIILAFVGLVLLFGQSSAVAGYSVGVGAVLFMVFMFFIELLVAFLQAYVFTLLAALYFGDATQEHHHDDHHESH